MFNIDLPDTLKPNSYYENGQIKFEPPVYGQRYDKVIGILQNEKLKGRVKKVIDFGCGNLTLTRFLKGVDHITHVIAIDIDEQLLRDQIYFMKPMLIDHLIKRENPFKIDMYKGSIDEPHECLKNTDVIICVEVIEHLFPRTLDDLPYNLFGYSAPNLLIFTTPNYDFNVLFDGPKCTNGFRHDDHKFEWTREQFTDWANNICIRYPEYQVHFYGIGPGPTNTEQYGHVTQMCIFIKTDFLNEINNKTLTSVESDMEMDALSTSATTRTIINNTDNITLSSLHISDTPILCTNNNDYILICSHVYPSETVKRTYVEKVLDEIKYQINRLKHFEEDYLNYSKGIFEIPFGKLFDSVFCKITDINLFRSILLDNDYALNEDDIIEIPNSEYDSDTSMEEDNNDDMNVMGVSINDLDGMEESWD